MTLSSRLAGRALPQATVPIQVSDPGEELLQRQAEAVRAAELAEALQQADATGALGESGAQVADRLREEAERLTVEVAEHYADITVQAIPAAEWERLVSEHSEVSDDTDEWDLSASALPHMLAACVVADPADADLRDPQWWAGRLVEWPHGDRLRLRSAVLHVNAPDIYQRLRALGKD